MKKYTIIAVLFAGILVGMCLVGGLVDVGMLIPPRSIAPPEIAVCHRTITVYILVSSKDGGFQPLTDDLGRQTIFWGSTTTAQEVINQYFPGDTITKDELCLNP